MRASSRTRRQTDFGAFVSQVPQEDGGTSSRHQRQTVVSEGSDGESDGLGKEGSDDSGKEEQTPAPAAVPLPQVKRGRPKKVAAAADPEPVATFETKELESRAQFVRSATECYFTLLVPASMKAHEYRVFVALVLESATVTKISYASCPCIGGSAGDCTHVGALLLVIHNLYRPPGSAGSALNACTSMLCLWNVPSAGVAYDFLKPVPFLRFTQENVNRPFKGNHVARESSWGRGGWNPFPDFLVLKTRADPDVQRTIRALHAELAIALGNLCGDQRQWPVDYVPADGFHDDPLENERRARKMVIHALMYLADKGFLVLDLLLEQSGRLPCHVHAHCVSFQQYHDSLAPTGGLPNSPWSISCRRAIQAAYSQQETGTAVCDRATSGCEGGCIQDTRRASNADRAGVPPHQQTSCHFAC